jgi:hypothetical protein
LLSVLGGLAVRLETSPYGLARVSIFDLRNAASPVQIDLKDSIEQVAGLLHPADEHRRAPFRSPVFWCLPGRLRFLVRSS